MPIQLRTLTLSLAVLSTLHAAVIGASKPAEPITEARIAQLPPSQRAAWMAYLQRSRQQRTADQSSLAAERKSGAPIPPPPPESFAARSKNLDMSGATRVPGQGYTSDNLSKHPGADDFDTPLDANWNYVGTLDNDATTTELRFLALVAATAPEHAAAYQTSFLKGIRYLLAAQFPNGGWPQVWPLEGGYHDAITYNDNAVTQAAELLTAVSKAQPLYTFATDDLRRQSATAADHALQCILKPSS